MAKKKKIINEYAFGGGIVGQYQDINTPMFNSATSSFSGGLGGMTDRRFGFKAPDKLPISGVQGIKPTPGFNIDGAGIAQAAQGVGELYSLASDNLKVPEVKKTEFGQATSTDELYGLTSSWNDKNGYDNQLGRSSGVSSSLKGIGAGAGTGAAIGTMFAPGVGSVIGGAIGGLVGGITGLFSSSAGNARRKRAEERANKLAVDTINSTNTRIRTNKISDELSNELAFGGSLGNGLTEFKTGGTHEQNPNGGIQQGYGDNGKPNLVEQGEVKYGDFVFSNRLKVSNAEKAGLPKSLNGKTFAKAVKEIQKEVKERPNDQISNDAFESNLALLASIQEASKPKEQTDMNEFADGGDLRTKFDPNKPHAKSGAMSRDEIMGIIKQKFPKSEWKNAYNFIQRESSGIPDNYRLSKHNKNGGNDLGLFQINTKWQPEMARKYNLLDPTENISAAAEIYKKEGWKPWRSSGRIPSSSTGEIPMARKKREQLNTLMDNNYNPVVNSRKTPSTPIGQNGKLTQDKFGIPIEADRLGTPLPGSPTGIINNNTNGLAPKFLGVASDINQPVYSILGEDGAVVTPKTNNSTPALDSKSTFSDIPSRSKWDYGRYAPVLSNLMTAVDLAGETADKTSIGRVAYQPITQRARYNPIDTDYMANRFAGQAAGVREGIVGLSGGNRGVATAGLLAANNQATDAYGDLMLKAKEYNDRQRQSVLDFNRQTDMSNAQGSMQAQQYNAGAADREAMINAQNEAALASARRDAFNTMATNVGQISTEKRWEEIVPRMFRGYSSTGEYNSKACGGKLKRRR